MEFLKNIFKSIFIGAGTVAPGVSGGALAIVLGLYEKIIQGINNIFKEFKKHFSFLLSVGIGSAIGVVIFSSVLLLLLEKYPLQTMFSFAGLVVGTLPLLFKTANKKGYSNKLLIPFFVSLILGIIFSLINKSSISDNINQTEVVINAYNIIMLFLIGFVLAGSLVIPGISGTVLLLLLGVYGLVMNAISGLKDIFKLPLGSQEMFADLFEKLYILIPLGLGLVVGILFFSKLMGYLIKLQYSITYYAILGFVIGSLPEFALGLDYHNAKVVVLSLILFLAFTVISLQINKFAKD